MEFKAFTLHYLLIAQILKPSSVLGSISCKFPAIFNFGDSNSDTGGFSAAFGQAPPPNGETFFHSPAGRNSDGRLIIDFIGMQLFLLLLSIHFLDYWNYMFMLTASVAFVTAERLGLPYLNAYLDSLGSNFRHGANFATASATIRPQNLSLFSGGYSPISLNVQQVEYSDFTTRSQVVREKGTYFCKISCMIVFFLASY